MTRAGPDGPARSRLVQRGIGGAEIGIYVIVVSLLIVAVVFTIVGTITHVIQGAHSRRISDTGVFILDRVLLLFIIGELLYTLRLVNLGEQILVEPFLLIGLIAIVRRVLVLTAEFEAGRGPIHDFVLQIAALAGLALALTIAIYMLRRSERLSHSASDLEN